VLEYVDNIIYASSSQEATMVLLNSLEKKDALKFLGDLHYLLGMEVHRVVLSQERYPSEIIERVGVKDCKN
jgi:hypothetical protein